MYYVEQNEQILLFDEDKQKLENSLTFMPQYAGLEIKETDRPIVDFQFADTEEYKREQEQKERERIAKLHLTRGDVFRGLLQAKGITKAQIRAMIEAMPERKPQEKIEKEMALIDFDDALEFYRGNALIDTLGTQLGITTTQLDKFFEAATVEETKTDAYKYLTNVIFTINTIPEETTVTINETEGKNLSVPYGSNVEYSVSAEGYISQSGTVENLTEDKEISVELEPEQVDTDSDTDSDLDTDNEQEIDK